MSQGPARFFIGGFEHRLSADDLYEYFSSFGTLTECRLHTTSTKESRGFGWITFARPPVPNVMKMNHTVKGVRVNIEMSRGEGVKNNSCKNRSLIATALQRGAKGGGGSGGGGATTTTVPPQPAYGTDSNKRRRSRRRSRSSSSSRRSYSSRSSSSRSDEESSRYRRRRHRRRSSSPYHRHTAAALPAAPNPNIVGVVAPLPSSSAAATSSSTAPSHHHQPPPTPPQRGGYNSGKQQQQQQQPMYPSLPQPSATAGGAAGASAGVTMICVPYAICPPEMVRDPRACIGQYFAERQVVQVTSPPLM